ncbi:phosphate acyltransferase PlsX [Endothiovibrio diazotrophicus]
MTDTAITIALDAMGGDFGPDVVVPAALKALRKHPELKLILVGDREAVSLRLAAEKGVVGERLRIQHASQRVEMSDPPALALRNKKDSSMRVAINLVKEGGADAAVSAGNTGALMATARFVLKTLPGIDRPAIMTAIPSLRGHTNVLDLGANVDCSAEHLFQFGVMGSITVSAVDGIAEPAVGLLNVGEEDIKGNEQVKEAHALLERSELRYIGFVEGDDIFKGKADVVVCDGFVGNVFLKTTEGLAKMISHNMKAEFKRGWYSKLAAVFALPVLRRFRAAHDPRAYNGASLLGLNGIVIKSHGGADPFAFGNAIRIAMLEVRKQVPQAIRQRVESQLIERQAV